MADELKDEERRREIEQLRLRLVAIADEADRIGRRLEELAREKLMEAAPVVLHA